MTRVSTSKDFLSERAKFLDFVRLPTLHFSTEDGHIELKYLDESGFCLSSPVSYSYSRIGQPEQLEQTAKRYDRRISILGV